MAVYQIYVSDSLIFIFLNVEIKSMPKNPFSILQMNVGPTIIFIIFLDILMFYKIFLSPQVKQCAIITYKHGIFELPQELPNDLRLRILEN